MTARNPQTRAALPTAARGSALPDADPAGVPTPVPGTPATSSRQAVSPDSQPDGRPGPETRRPGPAEVRAGDQSPAGVATPREGTTPAGSTFSTEPAEGARGGDPEPGRGGQGPPRPGQGARPALRGAEWRKEAAKAARRRPAKTAPRAAAKAPAIPPPPASGASLTASARCLSGCEWTAGPDDPGEVDKAARTHTEKPPKHATNLFSEPAAGAA